MIRTVRKLSESLDNKKIINYFSQSVLTEKLDLYYFKVKVNSISSISICKSTCVEVNLEDMILTRMWKSICDEISETLLSKPGVLKEFVGKWLGFFYLPCETPLRTPYSKLYNDGVRYILGGVFSSDKAREKLDLRTIGKLILLFKDDKRFAILEPIVKKFPENDEFISNLLLAKDDEKELEKVIVSVVDRSKIFADDGIPEGFILSNYKYNYQILEREYPEYKEPSKLGMEYTISLFCLWINRTSNYRDFLHSSYIDTVCDLFLHFIEDTNIEAQYYGLTAKELEAPRFGYYAGTGYEFIPNDRVRKICQEDERLCNIFKILLNGLRKKKENESYEYLTKDHQQTWNDLVRKISLIEGL